MTVLQNPLRRPRPSREATLFSGTYHAADADGVYVHGAARYKLRLTADELWLSKELSIPLRLLRSVEACEEGRVRRRRFLRITFLNPINGEMEGLTVCRLDDFMLGIYRRKPLVRLKLAVDAAVGRLPAEEAQGAVDSQLSVPVESGGSGVGAPARLACEVCGSAPAYYVGYRTLMAAVAVWWVSEEKRRTHCRKHNLLVGSWAYLKTAVTGWLGISILVYPVMVYRAALAMRPSVGRFAYALGVAPVVGVAALVAALFLQGR